MVADWFTVGVTVPGVGVEETFEQLPSLLGRQLEHCFPAFTQAQPLHEPVLLHLQQRTISLSHDSSRFTAITLELRAKYAE